MGNKDTLLAFGNIFTFINVFSMSAITITLKNILNVVYRCQTQNDLFVSYTTLL